MSNSGFRGYRTISQHLNDLKKENFSLKLRIYFLEEKIQQKFEASSDDVHRRNIELKVEVESLKKELQDKQELLDEAVATAENLSSQNEAELQRRLAERQEEISHMQDILQAKVQRLQEEAELAREEAQQMASLADSEARRCLALEREMVEKMEEMGGPEGPCNHNTRTDTDRLIEELTQQKHSLGLRVEELQVKVQDLSSSLKKKEREAKHLVGEQQDQLSQYESAAGQCVTELQTAQNQVCSLHAKIQESESRNQKLQERLAQMELELRSAREEAQQQERNTQNLSDVVNSKEAEATELCRVIDEQNRMLCSLRELASRSQFQQLQVSGAETGQGQGEVLALQGSLFQAQLELQASQRTQQQAARAQHDQSRALQRLENDLQGALLHKRETERHNQELQLALQRTQAALQEKEEQLRKRDHDRCQADWENERTIRELRTSLQTKEQLLEEYSEMLEDPKEQKDSLVQKLRQRIKERDRALEKAVDDRFRCVEEKEETARRLQLLIREKDRDLERQRCVLTNNEETIASLEMLVRGKTLQLEQVSDTWRSAQLQRQELEERQSCVLKERDGVIERLQTALQALTQEAQGLRSSLLAQIHSTPGDITEELKLRLQLKDHLLQEVLADRSHQARQHEEDIQDLLRTISSKDQYIQESAAQLSQVIAEQTSRLQELRRQLGSGFGPSHDSEGDLCVELQALKEELSLAMRREKESEELSRSQAARIDSLCRTLHVKEEIIGDFQKQLADPSQLPLVEQLTQEVQELRESLVQLDSLSATGSVLASGGPAEFGELSSEGEDEADEGLNSEYTESVDEEESNVERRVRKACSSELQRGGEGLSVVKLLVEQKLQVERELGELKMQLEKTGFSSLSQIRKALMNLQAENEDLKHQLQRDRRQNDEQRMLESEEEEEEELDVTIEEDEEQAVSELWEAWDGELTMLQAKIQNSDELKNRRAKGLESLSLLSRCSQDLEAEQPAATCEKRVRLQQRSQELQERLMVSEATVQAQAEQLKDYRELLTEAAVQQDSKQVQVDQQDLGYETCGRSENEAEREDASSPEFDDLEMCTSLDCHSQWWPSTGSSSTKAPSQSHGDEVSSLQRLVEDLRTQLSRSQAVIHGLQGRLRTLSTSSNLSTPRKVNWSFQASASQSGAEEDEGWGSSDGGVQASPRHPHQEKGLRELMSRVDALEDQLRKDGRKSEEKRSSTLPGEFDALIQAQARELSHLRQRLRDGRSVCSILTQHLGDTTKAFEELLRANDIDFYMGQSFREQLAQGSSLAHRVATKISGRDLSEDPEEKTELLAIRLSKELQQKDKVIESLRAKLNQHHRSDTPCSSHALSDITDQSDRISYVSDDHGSTNEELDLGSDGASEPLQEDAQTSARVRTDCHSHDGIMSRHPSISSSILSSHHTQSCLSCPSLHCSSSPHKPTGGFSQAAPASVFTSAPFHPPLLSSSSRPGNSCLRLHSGGGGGFSLAEVQRELQMLQRQLADSKRFSTPQPKPLAGFPFAHQQSVDFLSLPYQGLQPSPYSSAASSSSLDASLAMKTGASLLESSVLWGTRTARVAADLSSGSSGYQSGASHAGSDLMKEHLREIRSLRQRLEDSIQTNDRLRQQLEERLSRTASEKGAPTNIYIQGLDSVSQLSCLKEENISLQAQLKQATREGSKEVEQLRDALLQEQARLKEAELNAERWAEENRKMQGEAKTHIQEILELKQDQQQKQETINRLQHEVSILQQQLSESSRLLRAVQSEASRRLKPHPGNTHTGEATDSCQPGCSSTVFDPRELHLQLERQLSGQTGERGGARRRLFQDNVVSPPVRDTGLCSPSSPLLLYQKENENASADLALTSDGLHAVGRAADFKALQQLLLDSGALLLQMEATICSLNASREDHLHKPSDSVTLRRLLSDAQTLREFLQDADALAQTFWSAASTKTQESGQTRSLKEEVSSLRLQLSEQEKALKDTTERLRSSDLTKDSMERFIVSQLSRTRDVLKQAKTNLQGQRQEASMNSATLLVGVS